MRREHQERRAHRLRPAHLGARGLVANLKEHTVRLESRVNGRFHPRPVSRRTGWRRCWRPRRRGPAALPAGAAAAAKPRAQPITLDAQSSELDSRIKNDYVFHKVKISQGPMSVAADQAQARPARSEFRGQPLGVPRQRENHHGPGPIDLRRGATSPSSRSCSRRRSSPARRRRSSSASRKTGKPVRGHAELIDYDVAKGTVQLVEERVAQRRTERDPRRIAQIQHGRAEESSPTPPNRIRSACTSSSRRRRRPKP